MKKTDWAAESRFSPYAGGWLRFWFSRSGLAVFLALLVFGLGARALGQSVLTAAQVSAFDALVGAAKGVDPQYLKARADEAQKRGELSPLGAVSAGVSAGAGVNLGSQSGFDQVTPGYRLNASVNLDLKALTQSVRGANAAQIEALTNSTSAAARDLRVRVLQSYTGYLSAVRAAGVASDALELARASLGQAQARAQAGAATGVDVMRAAQQVNAAAAEVYDRNLSLAVSKQQLSAITGLTLSELDRALIGAKPKP